MKGLFKTWKPIYELNRVQWRTFGYLRKGTRN
jgi:hypothetical protein